MLANKVSPASLLCGNTRTGSQQLEMSFAVQGLGGSVEAESQHSQASLFASGSEPASSMELFSEPAYSSSLSCTSQHSQNDISSHHLSTHTTNDGQSLSQDEGRGIQNIQLDQPSGQQHSQGHNKYYMRYLSAAGSLRRRQQQGEGLGSTPLATGSRQGDTAHSKAAFERWKLKQQDRLEKQKLIEEVVSLSSSGYAKELKATLENLRQDVKEAIGSEITSSNNREMAQLKETELTQELLQQLAEGQAEIKQQLRDLRSLCSQQNTEVAALKVQVSTLGEQHTKTIQSTLSTEVATVLDSVLRPNLHQLEAQVSKLSEQLKTHHSTTQPKGTSAAVREGNSGVGSNSQQTRNQQHHHPTTTDARVPTHPPPLSCDDITAQSRNSQIQRKRKGARDCNPQPNKNSNSKNPAREGEELMKLLSQSSTESISTPCDIDLTQHSPLCCSQVISDSLLRLKQTSASSQPASQLGKTAPKIRPGAPSSPTGPPAAKRKRQTGRVKKQRPSPLKAPKVLATPKVTRRSQRLRKQSAVQPAGRPSQPASHTKRKEEKECGAELKIKTEVPSEGRGNWGGGTGSDVLDDWLDFRPPPEAVTSSGNEVKPVSRFQRSSEIARRRQVVNQQMSSALAATDSVLRELFSSAPSILSP